MSHNSNRGRMLDMRMSHNSNRGRMLYTFDQSPSGSEFPAAPSISPQIPPY